MTRYYVQILVRPDDESQAEEKLIRHRVTARTELEARRQSLECAWYNRYLVSRFVSIEERATP